MLKQPALAQALRLAEDGDLSGEPQRPQRRHRRASLRVAAPAATRKRASKLEAKQSKLATARAKVIALEAQMTAKQRSLQVA